MLPSGEIRQVSVECRATIGEVENSDHQHVVLGKAGRSRWLGRRPKVRGVAMDHDAHPWVVVKAVPKVVRAGLPFWHQVQRWPYTDQGQVDRCPNPSSSKEQALRPVEGLRYKHHESFSEKGPHVDYKLYLKVEKQEAAGENKPIKTWAYLHHRAGIHRSHLQVHNIRAFIDVYVTEDMVGHKLGEFSHPARSVVTPTRRRA